MVEVHLVWLERSAAVGARPSSDFAQERESRVLALAHPRDLPFAIPSVVRDVVGALVSGCSHSLHDRTCVRNMRMPKRLASRVPWHGQRARMWRVVGTG